MGTTTAFISEIHYISNDTPPREFVEVALHIDEDPNDYTLSFYKPDGTLRTNIPLSNAVNGEISLTDATSVVPDPDNPNYLIYTITSDTRYLFTAGSTPDNEARAVTLYNTQTNQLIDGYAVGSNDVTIIEGVANGETAASTGTVARNNSLQWDYQGNFVPSTRTPGDAIVCFHEDTKIKTLFGEIKIRDIRAGTYVWTADNGYQPVLWCHNTFISRQRQINDPASRPILIKQGSLGEGLPQEDLLVSGQHRILLRSVICERMFGQSEVLVPAKALTCLDGVTVATPMDDFFFVHLLFGKHEILLANNYPCESLLLGEMVLNDNNPQRVSELQVLLQTNTYLHENHSNPARLLVRVRKAKTLLQRHQRNNKLAYST